MTSPTLTLASLTDAPAGLARERCGCVLLRQDRVRLRTVIAGGRLVGHVSEILLDASASRLAGFVTRGPDGGEGFVPLPAVAAIGPTGIEVSSTLHIVDDVDFYRSTCRPAGELLGQTVGGGRAGRRIDDIEVDAATGVVTALILSDGQRAEPMSAAPTGAALSVAS